MSFALGTIEGRLKASAETDGWKLCSDGADSPLDLSQRSAWPTSVLDSPEGMTALLQIEMLLEMEVAEARDGDIWIPWSRFADVLQNDITLPTRWTTWSPFLLSITSTSEIGRPDFAYEYAYRLGNRAVSIERYGYFVRRRLNDQLFHLDPQTYSIIDAMDSYNHAADHTRQERGWSTLASIKGAALPTGAMLDEYLESNDVLVPSELSLDVFEHEDGSVSFVPKCPDVGSDAFREAFLRQSSIPNVYSIDGLDGRKVRLLIGQRHRDVLERMKQGARLSGRDKDAATRAPERFFDGLLDAVSVEYGSRVIGIGDYSFASVPSDPRGGSEFFKDDEASQGGRETESQRKSGREPAEALGGGSAQIELPGADEKKSVLLKFPNGRAVDAARDAVAEALSRGDKTVVIQDQEIQVSKDAVDALSSPPTRSEVRSETPNRGRKFLLVYTNETAILEADQRAAIAASSAPAACELNLPRSIAPGIQLMPHQVKGISWILQCDSKRPERTGVLLADDMGLGKTLQVLGYMASLMEAGRVPAAKASDGSLRWRPFLIVAPLILVENKTWENEIRKSFTGGGAAFDPILVLHGRGIDQVRAAGMTGQETRVGHPILDIDKLMSFRTIITTYETAVTYQHSLAQLKDRQPLWSVLVTDEAQRYKAPNTKVSHAIKAIASAAAFRIANTGTPVENRLLDLWTIVDSSVQTALLGDRQTFSNEFERPAASGEAGNALGRLRKRLLCDEPHAFLLRRSKSDVLDLPAKTEFVLDAEMSPDECAAHRALVATLREEHGRGQHLAVLHQLAQLYQHPALLRGNPSALTTDDLLKQSAKLRAVVKKLTEIRARGEKVIVFARLLAVQQILSRVIEKEFQVKVPVINGMTSRDSGYDGSTAATGRAQNARKSILDEFERQAGFGVVILSPHVAGIGLTITAANHVIHYGRWWNPAIEAQATDRAYRIGQSRPVSVYLPILRYPAGLPGRTFDQRLNDLMVKKTALRQDFLHPDTEEDDNANEICRGLQSDAEDGVPVRAELPFNSQTLAQLSPLQFEAAVGALFIAEGYLVVLTARSGDGGADVIAASKGALVLVQAKHSRSNIPIDEAAIGDVVGALDIYGRELAADCDAMIVTNAAVSQAAVAEARRFGIELLSGNRLVERLREAGVGLSAMAACEARRCRTFAEGLVRAKLIVPQINQ